MKNIVQGSLITTFRCNAKCNMCNIWKNQTKPSEEIDPSYYEKLPAGLRINITGGEATIRQDIDRIFEILYPKSSLLELSTNGYNTEKIVALANKYPIDKIDKCMEIYNQQIAECQDNLSISIAAETLIVGGAALGTLVTGGALGPVTGPAIGAAIGTAGVLKGQSLLLSTDFALESIPGQSTAV